LHGGVRIVALNLSTSGALLLTILQRRAEKDPAFQDLYDLACDVGIKQRSFALLNKLFWVLALLLTIALLAWPLVAAWMGTWGDRLLDAAVAQTMLTALAAFAVYFYQYYKKRQLAAENLLRLIAFSKRPAHVLVQQVIDELSRIDQGFGFSIGKAQDGSGDGGSDGGSD
jgi:hypothetical protein